MSPHVVKKLAEVKFDAKTCLASDRILVNAEKNLADNLLPPDKEYHCKEQIILEVWDRVLITVQAWAEVVAHQDRNLAFFRDLVGL